MTLFSLQKYIEKRHIPFQQFSLRENALSRIGIRHKGPMKKFIPLTLLYLAGIIAAAHAEISIGLNHPELTWSLRKTPHFKIIYHNGTEILAEKAAVVAEAVLKPIAEDLGGMPSKEITIIISDFDDLSNGLATPLGHSIFIWAKSFNKYTTGTMNWLRRVIAHELTHQLHFLSQRNLLGTPWELISFGTTSTWFTEGLAQYEAERWDDHRDLLLRVASHSNALLDRKRLEGFLGGDLIHFRLVYEQGHSLVRYIAEKYGADKIKLILQKQRQFPLSFNLALKRAIGVSEQQLIEDWRKKVKHTYSNAATDQELLASKHAPFQTKLQAVYGLRWSPDGQLAAVVGIESFREGVTRLYLFDATGKQLKTIDGPGIGGFFSWAPDGRSIVYSKLRRGKNGRLVNDLMLYALESGHRNALTHNLRATDPAWSPDGKQIVFCQHQGPLSNLVLYEIETGKLTPLTRFDDWHEVFAPNWKTDGSAIAFSFIAPNGWRNIATIRPDGSEFTLITQDSIDARTPVWHGEKLAYISYQSGQANLVVRDFKTQTIHKKTNAYGGLFNPAWKPDGTAISVVAFEQRDSIHVYTLPIDSTGTVPQQKDESKITWHQTIPPNAAPKQIAPSPLFRTAEELSYRGIFHVRPHLTLPNFDYDDRGLQFGIYNISADPLEKHTLISTLTGGKRLHFAANYINRQFLPTISLFISQRSFNRGTFQGFELWEKDSRASFSVQVPFNFGQNLYANHFIWLGGEAREISNYNPAQYKDLPVWAQPFSGWINTLNLGYAYSTGRPSTHYDIHPDAGFQLNLVARQAEKFWGSDLNFTQFSLATVFRTRTIWRQIFCLRSGYFQHNGGQRIQSRYAMGNSMIRGLTPSIEGTQMLYANLDYRFPVICDLGLKIWFVYLEGLFGAGFTDVGWVWGEQLQYSRRQKKYIWFHHELNAHAPVGTFGAELRLRSYLAGKIAVILKGGIAKRWDKSTEINYYYLIGPVF